MSLYAASWKLNRAVTTASGNRVHVPRDDTFTVCGIEWSDDQRSDLLVDCIRCLRIKRDPRGTLGVTV